MTDSVTSGRGRRGPWLQNRWLRVETRQDDGSISPIALEGAFRPTARAAASVVLGDGSALSFERADYDVGAHDDARGAGKRIRLTSQPRAGIRLLRDVALYDARPFCVTSVGITNEGAVPLPVSAFHVFRTAEGRGRLQLEAPISDWRIYRNGWQSWSPTMSFGGAERDTQSRPPVLSPAAPEDEPGRFNSDDVGVIFDPGRGRSLLAGAITARDYATQVHVDAPAKALDVRCLVDGLVVAPGETLWSERVLVDLAGGPNEQLERYGDVLGAEMGARLPPASPSGWCSWYYFYTQVTEDDIVRNLRFLDRHRREFPIDTVQIDDGYQADIGDWLTVNEKFPHGMRWLASEIRQAGFRPGIWLAPFLLSESSQTYAQHGDWVVRDDDGAPVVANHNWLRDNYGLDGSHPEALAWLRDLFGAVCDGWGYEYVKVDFLFAAAMAGRRHGPATRVRAYRQALQAIRDAVGDHRFVLGCGALMAPSVGLVDGNRIGPDVAPFWRNLTREERERPSPRPRSPDDDLSVETAVRNTLTRSWMHNRLWANDPDCLLVRTDRTKMTLDEVRTLAGVIGLSGGMVLSSDDLERVPPERAELISMLLPPLPVAATAVDLMERDMPERFEVHIDRDFDPLHVVGLFNFQDVTHDLVLPLPEGRWHVFELWEERYLGARDGAVTFTLVAPHASRIVSLRRVRGEPCVVGSTAHVGMGAVDMTAQTWDAATSTLRIDVSPTGRADRQLWVATAGLRLRGVEADGASLPFNLLDGAAVVRLDVHRATSLRFRFSSK